MSLLRAIFGLGIAPHLFHLDQAGAREFQVQGQPLLRLPTGVADFVDLRLRERIAMPLCHSESTQKNEPSQHTTAKQGSIHLSPFENMDASRSSRTFCSRFKASLTGACSSCPS